MNQNRHLLGGFEHRVWDLVRKGATERQWTEWLRVPLEHAAAAGDKDLVEKLMGAGGRLKAGWHGCGGRTMLMAAAQGGNEAVVSMFLDSGAQPEVNVTHGQKAWSILHYAAYGGHEAIGRTLMIAGANPGYVDVDNASPLHIAVRGGHSQLVGDLLLRGAPCDEKDREGDTPLHIAVANDRGSIVKTLLRSGADFNQHDSKGRSPLCVAVVRGNLCAVKALLSADPNRHVRYLKYDGSALGLAAGFGFVEVMTTLFQHHNDIHDVFPSGTALNAAAICNQVAAVEALVEMGAAVDAVVPPRGSTSLHKAARRNHCGAVQALLRNQANVDFANARGHTPLALACKHLSRGAAELLLQWGANENAIDRGGLTVADLVGATYPQDIRSSRAEDAQELRKLLYSAPADRAWRRRCFLVMCRAFPNRLQIMPSSDQPVTSRSSEACFDTYLSEPAATPESEENVEHGDKRARSSDAAAGFACVDAEGTEVHATAVQVVVIKLEPECVFRNIISFL